MLLFEECLQLAHIMPKTSIEPRCSFAPAVQGQVSLPPGQEGDHTWGGNACSHGSHQRQGTATGVLPSSKHVPMGLGEVGGWWASEVGCPGWDGLGRGGGREHLSLQHEGCAPPISCPTDKGLILWGRGTVAAAKQEGRKEGIWKE